jgi:hypothetical protein
MDEEDFVFICRDDAQDATGCSVTLPPKYLQDVDDFVDNASGDLWNINKQIHNNPELGYEEHKAHALLTCFMKSVTGWNVTASAYGIATAWVATYDRGKKGPVVSFQVEMGTAFLSI